MFDVSVKSAIGALTFDGELFGGGVSCKIIPPGPRGTDKKDFPKNLIDVGIPVIHELVNSSTATSVPAFCFCIDVSFPLIFGL